MNRTTHLRPIDSMGFAAQAIGTCFGGIMAGFLHQASAKAGVAATK
jgi:hypothetical protein